MLLVGISTKVVYEEWAVVTHDFCPQPRFAHHTAIATAIDRESQTTLSRKEDGKADEPNMATDGSPIVIIIQLIIRLLGEI